MTVTHSPTARLGGRVLLAGLGALVLTACTGGPHHTASIAPVSVEDRHPIIVQNQPVSMEVAVHPAAVRLTPAQRVEVSRFLQGYKGGGPGRIVVETPSGAANETAALGVLAEIRELAAMHGIAESQMDYRPYGGRGQGGFPPIVMVYTGYQAVTETCGAWPEDLGKNAANRPYHDFGCSAQNNLAALVANPRDLVTPRDMDPPSAERRAVVRGKYIAGEATGGRADSDNRGQVSEVAQ